MLLSRILKIITSILLLFPNPKYNNQINYELADKSSAIEIFADEPFLEDCSQLFIDICSKKKNSSKDEWLDKNKQNINSFSEERQNLLKEVAKNQNKKLSKLKINLPLNSPIQVIDFNFKDFGGAAGFTTQSRIYINFDDLPEIQQYYEFILWHELWHILSRNNPELRKQMYSLIGFTILDEEIEIPSEIKSRILTNPDVERHDSYATFTINGNKKNCMVLLYCPDSEYTNERTINYYISHKMAIWLLPLSQDHRPYKNSNGEWEFFSAEEAEDFDAVMSGGNTDYCDDPEECIADNFAYAMMDYTTLPNQQLLDEIRQILKK